MEISQADSASTSFSIIIPAFNERDSIRQTIDHIHSSLNGCGCKYELIIVDDGSVDGTADVLLQCKGIHALRHTYNQGYGAALKTGIRQASHSLVVITDADGTYPNERIPELVSLCSDYDMVVGARTGANVTYPLIRKIPKFFLKRFAEWMAREAIPDMNSGLRVFRKEVAERFLGIFPDGFSFTTTITLAMLTNNYRVRFEPVDYHPRIGKSKIKPIRDTLRFVQLILRTGMYFAPLRVFLPVAFLFFVGFVGSLLYDVFVLENLTEKSLILLVTATQMMMFALLADMIDKRSA